MEFGIVTTELSAVCIFVHLNEISITSPSFTPTEIQSPTKKGLSESIEKPDIKFLSLF